VFSAKGAVFTLAWGNAPGSRKCKTASAESAIYSGAFSVSPSQLEAVLPYVQRQEERHRARTFQEEYRELLGRHGIEFDEQYMCGIEGEPVP